MEHDSPVSGSNPPPPALPPMPPRQLPPPLIVPPPPGSPTRRGKGWKVFAIVALLLLIVSVLFNFVRLLPMPGAATKGTRHGGHSYQEVTFEDNDSPNKIAIIDVAGLITSGIWDGRSRGMVRGISDQLDLAAEDHRVKAVVLKVETPGGEVLASDEINRVITEFQEKSGKPAVACMGSVAASGGYYVSAPCRWIVAHEMTITGSIGVVLHSYNYRGLMNKVGVRPEVFKSGRFKDMLSGEKNPEEVLPEERAMLQTLIDETFARFKRVVATGRQSSERKNKGNGKPLSKEWEDFADGRILSGKQAFELGFVDELGNMDTAVRRAEKLANISRANLVKYQEPLDLFSLFRLFGKAEPTTIKVDLGMDFPKLQAGRLYFVAPSLLP